MRDDRERVDELEAGFLVRKRRRERVHGRLRERQILVAPRHHPRIDVAAEDPRLRQTRPVPQHASAAAAPVEQRLEALDGRPLLEQELTDLVGVVLSAAEEERRVRMERADLRAQARGRQRHTVGAPGPPRAQIRTRRQRQLVQPDRRARQPEPVEGVENGSLAPPQGRLAHQEDRTERGRNPYGSSASLGPLTGPGRAKSQGVFMRFRFIRALVLAAVVAAAFAGVARALDFDDEDPEPPHPEIGLVYHYEIGTHAGCLPHKVVILSGALPPGLKLSQLNDHTVVVDVIATASRTFSVWLAVHDCENKSAETLFTFDVWARRFSIATASLPSAGLGASYSATLQTAGIDSNTTWTVTSGALPAGLTLSS